MDHGMTRVFATLFDEDTEMIQLAIERFGMVRRGSLLHLNDSTNVLKLGLGLGIGQGSTRTWTWNR